MEKMSPQKLYYAQIFGLMFGLALGAMLVKSLAGGWNGQDETIFGHRKLIAAYANLRLTLGDRGFPNALVGQEGWLFMTTERAMDDYQGAAQFAPEQLSELSAQLWDLYNRLEARGIKLVVLIAPNKQTVYSDKMPPEIGKVNPQNRMSQFYEAIGREGPPILMDLRPLLAAGRQTREVYLKTDTHWNAYGAYLTYQALLLRLKPDFPALEIHPDSEFTFSDGTPMTGDLAANTGGTLLRENALALETAFKPRYSFRELELTGERQVTMTWRADAPNLPRLVMFHDSFGFDLRFLLADHFSQAIFVPHFSGQQVWNLNWIEQEAPDVVVIEFTERYLDSLGRLLGK